MPCLFSGSRKIIKVMITNKAFSPLQSNAEFESWFRDIIQNILKIIAESSGKFNIFRLKCINQCLSLSLKSIPP